MLYATLLVREYRKAEKSVCVCMLLLAPLWRVLEGGKEAAARRRRHGETAEGGSLGSLGGGGSECGIWIRPARPARACAPCAPWAAVEAAALCQQLASVLPIITNQKIMLERLLFLHLFITKTVLDSS